MKVSPTPEAASLCPALSAPFLPVSVPAFPTTAQLAEASAVKWAGARIVQLHSRHQHLCLIGWSVVGYQIGQHLVAWLLILAPLAG